MSTFLGTETETPGIAAGSGSSIQDLWQRYHQQADTDLENALIEKYLSLVSSIAARLAMTLPEHVSQDDLYSSGLVGLLQALRNYDPASAASFETYARMRIRGAMLDELRRMDWVPRTVHEKARKLQAAMNELEQKLGCVPTEIQMAQALNLSLAQYGKLLTEIRPAAFICLDTVSSDDDSGDLYDVVANSADESPLEKLSHRELERVIWERLEALPEMQRKVLGLYYGEEMHLREIAEVVGLTESRICQIHAQAILSIRGYIHRYEAGLVKQNTKITGWKI